jgi:hypothetical protein
LGRSVGRESVIHVRPAPARRYSAAEIRTERVDTGLFLNMLNVVLVGDEAESRLIDERRRTTQ